MPTLLQSIHQSNQSSIVLQTSRGRDIENEQAFEISGMDKAFCQDLDRQYFSSSHGVIRRSEYIATYNCHGMTFASRRTAIKESEELWKIIDDDGYVQIIQWQDVLPGDVVLYLVPNSATQGGRLEIDHSGIVVSVPSDLDRNPMSEFHIKICSKWGSYSEVIHGLRVCPYEDRDIMYYRIKQQTLYGGT